MPENLDSNFKYFATRRYTQEALEELGLERMSGGHYILFSHKLGDISLVFEEKEDGKYGITYDNGVALGLYEPREPEKDPFFDEENYYLLKIENDRRAVEKSLRLKPGSLIGKIRIRSIS